MTDDLITSRSTRTPLLRPRALASGTIPSRDLSASRAFYVEVLGLNVIDRPPDALLIELGGTHTYIVEKVGASVPAMTLLNHNGFYLAEDQSVEEAHAKLTSAQASYAIRLITKPNWQHGYYAFFIQDRDGNWWEFHHAPQGSRVDLTGGKQLSAQEARDWFIARRKAPRGEN